MKRILTGLTAVILSALLTACSATENLTSDGGMTDAKGDMAGTKGELSGIKDSPSGGLSDGVAEDKICAEDFSPDKIIAGAEAEAPSEFFEADTAAPSDAVENIDNIIFVQAGTLTAGEWNDNDNYTFWQDLFQKEDTQWEFFREKWDRSYCARTFVTVTLGEKPVENAALTLTDDSGQIYWQAKTDNEGKAYLFYNASLLSEKALTVKAQYKDIGTGEGIITSENFKQLSISLSVDTEGDDPLYSPKALDFALMVDTTGSMADELTYLQKELESVINRVAADNGNIPIRLSVDFYRDDGDEYVVRDFDFTDDISSAIRNLNAQQADGGGDTPEKVNAALNTAVNGLSWEENSTKLLFIILDAPPHNEENVIKEMNELTGIAAGKGIRIIPILASGGDKETEFLMRDIALKTGGTYLFLTDHSGVSVGQHIEPTIGEYEVEKLNDLMVKTVNRYLAVQDNAAEYRDETVETASTDEPEEITTVYEQ